MRFNSLFVPFEFLVLSVRSGGQDSMQHGTVVAWKKQLEYTAARSNIHWRSSQNVHKCGPIKPSTCTFFLLDERNPANWHAWEAFCCHTAGCHNATHVRPSCLGVPSIQGSPNYTNADGRMESKWKYAWQWKWMFQFAFSHSISRFPGQNCSLSRKTQASPLCETKSELFSWRVEKLKPWDYRYQGGLDADSFEQKHGCDIFKSFQINSQCLILNKFRFKEPANGQSLARQPLIGKYQNGLLKNPLNREFKVTVSRHLVGFNCDPILVICILYHIAICSPLAWSVKKAFVIQKCALGLWPRLWPECGKQVFEARVKKVLVIEHLHHPWIEKALYKLFFNSSLWRGLNQWIQRFRLLEAFKNKSSPISSSTPYRLAPWTWNDRGAWRLSGPGWIFRSQTFRVLDECALAMPRCQWPDTSWNSMPRHIETQTPSQSNPFATDTRSLRWRHLWFLQTQLWRP